MNFNIINDFKIYSLAKRINESLNPDLEARLRRDLKEYCDSMGKDFNEVCKIVGLKTAGIGIVSPKLIDMLNKRVEGKWSIDEDKRKINIDGSISFYYRAWDSSITENIMQLKESMFEEDIKFGKITGDFILTGISGMSATMDINEIWENICPDEIGGSLNLSNNNFEKCILPKIINRDLQLSHNKIEVLEGLPEKFNGTINVSFNKLTSLIGSPKIINGSFIVNGQATSNTDFSLEGSPEIIEGRFDCSDNNLKTLKFSPKIIKGDLILEYNKLNNLSDGNLEEVGGYVNVSHNYDFYSFEGLPKGKSPSRLIADKALLPIRELRDTYKYFNEYKGWIPAYLKLATMPRFKRMGKAMRDPIVEKITPEKLIQNKYSLATIMHIPEIMDDPVVKRRMRKAGLDKMSAEDKEKLDALSGLEDLGLDIIGF